MREADVAIRLRQPTQPDLIQRRLFTVHMHLYAAPGYLERFGRPQTLAELDGHRIVTFGVPVPPISQGRELARGRRPRPRQSARAAILRINNLLVDQERDRARHRHRGPARLHGRARTRHWSGCLPEAEVPSFSTYFVYPAELKNSARVHVFRDFLVAKAQNWSF